MEDTRSGSPKKKNPKKNPKPNKLCTVYEHNQSYVLKKQGKNKEERGKT